jgi:phosphoserine phosphatase RsbU/P
MQGACLPAGDVGGDLYDHVLDDRGRLTALVADVAGHGLGSALVMAMGRNALRRAILAGAPPHEVLEAANAELLADLAETGLFITAFCVRLDPADGTLELANAGHNPPLLRRAGGRVEALDAEGLVLGVLDDPGVEGRCLRLAPGDALLLYTDGVVEAEGPGGRLLGLPRLQEVVREAGTGGPGALVEAVLDAVTGHSYGRGVSDDVTLLALAFDGAPLRAAT